MGVTLSMGGVLRDTQALQVMADGVFRHLTPYVQEVSHSALVLYWLAFASHLLLASQTANIAVTLPVVMDYAVNNDLNPLAVGMIWSFSASGKLFIYQSLVLIAGYTFGCYNGRDVFKIAAFFLFVDWILLFLLVLSYWPLVGIG